MWWWAAAAALAAIALGLFLLKRRGRNVPEWEEEEEEEALPQPVANAEPLPEPEKQPASVAELPRRPLPQPNFSPTPPAPAQAELPEDISVSFEPVTMRLSLFYATLQYRLVLTATGTRAPLKVLGDLISAHASLTQDEQLAPPPESLPQIHALPGLSSREPVELKGEIQLPLAAIRALRQGGGAFFVPLVRICLIGEDGTALRRVFTLGLPGGAAGLAPLRTDTGPRSFEPLAAREIELARQLPLRTGTLPLDPQRAAG